jgi:lipid A 3-O-deacylase
MHASKLLLLSALILLALLPQAVMASTAAPSSAASDSAPAAAAEVPAAKDQVVLPDQHGLSTEYGYAFDPHRDISFVMARAFAIYDYGAVWRSEHPKALRFKVEGAVGTTVTPDRDFMASVDMLAMYYPRLRPGQTLRPYVEGGIGIIYTEFRVPGQGLHFNFNPLLGVGCELPQRDGKNPFLALRLHHLSNGELYYRENRGVNSVVLQVGRYF